MPRAVRKAHLVSVMPLLSILLWLPVLFIEFLLWPLCAVVVTLTIPFGRSAVPKIFRNDQSRGRPFTWTEMVLRNNSDGWKKMVEHPPIEEIIERGTTEPGPTYHNGHFRWRWRRWRWLSSFRMVWVYPGRKRYGEWYIGWKLNSEPPDLDFASGGIRFWARVGQ